MELNLTTTGAAALECGALVALCFSKGKNGNGEAEETAAATPVDIDAVPAGLDANGLPLGLQVLGKPFDEATVFAVGAALERAAGFEALPALRAAGRGSV